MKFAIGRTQSALEPQQVATSGVVSAALQQSPLMQQQMSKLTAIRQSAQQQLQRKQLSDVASQNMRLAAKEPLQGKFEPAAVIQRQAETGSDSTCLPDKFKSEATNDEMMLKHQADVMEARALQLKSFDSSPKRKTTASQDVVQRLVVQSDWLRKNNDKMETATSSGGPWSACEDKTSAGYRDAAEQVLGSLDGINTLAKYKIIPPATMSGRGPLAKAHLIAAEFGGQLKYSPVENIRYHPLSVEYGQWQLDENQVGKSIGRGYITSRSTELGNFASTLMSLDIGKIVEEEYGYLAAYDVSRKFAQVLGAAASVPTSVSFNYKNIDNPKLDFNHSWDGLENVLQVQSVPAENVFSAMNELGMELPSNVSFDAVSNDVVINSREKLVELIGQLGIKGGSLKNLIKKVNQLKSVVKSKKISVQAATEALNKHPYLTTKPGTWILADSFDSWDDLV